MKSKLSFCQYLSRWEHNIRLLLIVAGIALVQGASAWDMLPDASGKYDTFFDRPTAFPDWQQPSEWQNAMYLLCKVECGKNGPALENYEIAVYDQGGNLRHCNRSIAKDQHHCVLTIKGDKGDKFTFKVIYGDDFSNPTTVDVLTKEVEFKANHVEGSTSQPVVLTIAGRTYLSEQDAEQPEDMQNADITLLHSLAPDVWETICLPFALTAKQVRDAFGNDAVIGDFQGCQTEYEADGETPKHIKAIFKEVNVMEANHPYIIKVSAPLSQIEIDGTDIHAEAQPVIKQDRLKTLYNMFVGNYTNNALIPANGLLLESGVFTYSTGDLPLKAYHAYFDFYDIIPGLQSDASRIEISFDDSITAISQLAVGNKTDTLYDLSGRRVKRASKGVYIRNGRKILTR